MQYFLILVGWLTAVGLYQNFKPLPEGLDYESDIHLVAEEDIDFLYDLTYEDSLGNIIHEQEIFDAIDSLVANAQKYVLIDMFLFNSFKGPGNYRNEAHCSSFQDPFLFKGNCSSPWKGHSSGGLAD